MPDVSNRDDIIDSRDVIARIEELESERQPLADAVEEIEADEPNHDAEALAAARAALADWDASDEGQELAALQALAKQGETLADWDHGEVLIRDSHFEDYARELAEDIGAIDPNAGWPLSYIDWPAAAAALQVDYTSLDFDGVTYWARG